MTTDLSTKRALRISSVRASHIGALIRLGEATDLSPWTASNYLEELKNPHSIMLRLADADDNSTCGFIVGRIVSGSDLMTRADAEVYNVAVHPDRQRHGYGQVLLDAFVNVCRERLVANIWLEVRESNHKAIRFYEKNGFQHVQSRSSFYENPRENALLMRCVLRY